MALGREAFIPELTNATLDKDDIVKADREDDPEKIADDIIMKASESVFVFHYKYGVVLIHKIFVPVLFSTFFKPSEQYTILTKRVWDTLFSLFYFETVRNQRFTLIKIVSQKSFPRST